MSIDNLKCDRCGKEADWDGIRLYNDREKKEPLLCTECWKQRMDERRALKKFGRYEDDEVIIH